MPIFLISSSISIGSNQDLGISFNLTSSTPGDTYFLGIAGDSILPLGVATTCSFSSATTFFISSSEATATSSIDTILEPYFSSNFSRAFDCQPLLNNTQGERPNPFLQDLDYQTSQTVPVNYQAVVSESATKATVPESNYTQLASTNIRYNGSKNTGQQINRWSKSPYPGQKWNLNTYYSSLNNEGNFGKTSPIDSQDTDIYEFEWGGGTTPEILGWGSFKMGKILQVQTTESVRTINASEGLTSRVNVYPFYAGAGTISDYREVNGVAAGVSPNINTGSLPNGNKFWEVSQSVSDYYYTLNGNNPVNTEITPIMYPNSTAGSNPTIPKTTKIITTEFGVPTISNYAATSSNTPVIATYGTSGGGFGIITMFDGSSTLNTLTTSDTGYYTSDGNVNEYIWSEIINESLNNGEKWFVTLYNEFEYPTGNQNWGTATITGSLIPYNVGYDIKDENGTISFKDITPLRYIPLTNEKKQRESNLFK